MLFPQPVPVRRRDRTPVLIQQHQGRRANFINKRQQPLRRQRIVIGRQGLNQIRITGQQLRHNGIALQLAHQVGDIKGQADFGPVPGRFREALGQQQIRGINRHHAQQAHHNDAEPQKPTALPQRAGLCGEFRVAH